MWTWYILPYQSLVDAVSSDGKKTVWWYTSACLVSPLDNCNRMVDIICRWGLPYTDIWSPLSAYQVSPLFSTFSEALPFKPTLLLLKDWVRLCNSLGVLAVRGNLWERNLAFGVFTVREVTLFILKIKNIGSWTILLAVIPKGHHSVWRDIVAWLAFLVDTPDLEKQTCHIMVAAAGGGLGILAARLVPCLKTQTLCKLYRFKTLSAEKVLVVPRHGCPKLAAWPLSVKL